MDAASGESAPQADLNDRGDFALSASSADRTVPETDARHGATSGDREPQGANAQPVQPLEARAARRAQPVSPASPAIESIELPRVRIARVSLRAHPTDSGAAVDLASAAASERVVGEASAAASDPALEGGVASGPREAARPEESMKRAAQVLDRAWPKKTPFAQRMQDLESAFESPAGYNAFLVDSAQRGLNPNDPMLRFFEYVALVKQMSDAGVARIQEADAQTGSGVSRAGPSLLDALAEQGDAVGGGLRELLADFLARVQAANSQSGATLRSLEDSARAATLAHNKLRAKTEDLSSKTDDLAADVQEILDLALPRLTRACEETTGAAIQRLVGEALKLRDGAADAIEQAAQQTAGEAIEAVQNVSDKALEAVETLERTIETQRQSIRAQQLGIKASLEKASSEAQAVAERHLVQAIEAVVKKSANDLRATAVSSAETYEALVQAIDAKRRKATGFYNGVTAALWSAGWTAIVLVGAWLLNILH